MNDRNYYVYVYIDPRNLDEFYYGKGKGSRRFAHLSDASDSEKASRIKAIQAEGLDPIIRTVATQLTEAEAHLVETTLIWKLGRTLTNVAAGRDTSRFRPHNTLHKEIPDFDFQCGIYYVNVGEGPHRNWDDCRKHGFLAAGQGPQWSVPLGELKEGDIVIAYLKKHGFVGVGRVLNRAVSYPDFNVKGRLLHELGLKAERMWENSDDPVMSEHVLRVEWVSSVPREEAKWIKNQGLYTTTHVRASLENQPETRAFIEQEFGVNLNELAQ